MELSNTLALGAVWAWIGFICAIVCVELLLKRRVPKSLQQPEGFTKFVVAELDRIEVYLAALVVASFMIGNIHPFASANVTFFIPVTLLLLQKVLAVPALGSRTEQILRGSIPRRSSRLRFAAFDVLKICSLLVFSFQLLATT